VCRRVKKAVIKGRVQYQIGIANCSEAIESDKHMRKEYFRIKYDVKKYAMSLCTIFTMRVAVSPDSSA
jgi:hypothetical protein